MEVKKTELPPAQMISGNVVGNELTHRHGWTPYLLYCNLSAVVAAFLFGYVGVMVNEPYQIFEQFINGSFAAQHNSTYLNIDDMEMLWTTTVSLFLVGGIFGSLLGGPQANRFGRKRSLLFNCLIGIVGGILMFMAPYVNNFEILMVGRVVSGFHCGLLSGIVPVYITELAPLSLRGASGVINHLSICAGALTSGIFGLPVVLARGDSLNVWPFLFFPCLILPIIQVVLLPFAVESPKWLMLVKQDTNGAIEALKKLRGHSVPVEVLLAELPNNSLQEASTPKLSFWNQLRGALSWPLVICVMMQLTQQLSGINAAIFYSSDIFKKAGLEGDTPIYASLGIVATTVVMAVVSVYLVERLGRRILMVFGVAGMWFSSALVTLFMVLSSHYATQIYNYLTIAVLILYVITFGVGPGPIPWFIAPELSLPQHRPISISICTFFNWCANLAIGFGFPPVQKKLGPYSFLPFFGLLTIFLVFALLFLPETRGKTPEESIRCLETKRFQLKISWFGCTK